MSMLRHSMLRAPCDECRRPFDPTYGGVCTRCNRMLCADHMYGSFYRRMRGLLGMREPCVKCRSHGPG